VQCSIQDCTHVAGIPRTWHATATVSRICLLILMPALHVIDQPSACGRFTLTTRHLTRLQRQPHGLWCGRQSPRVRQLHASLTACKEAYDYVQCSNKACTYTQMMHLFNFFKICLWYHFSILGSRILIQKCDKKKKETSLDRDSSTSLSYYAAVPQCRYIISH